MGSFVGYDGHMPTKTTFIMVILLLVALGIVAYVVPRGSATGPVACTTEAKLCPDGSAVGRTGPNCEFAACPSETSGSTGNALAIGASATINGTTIGVLELIEDSRCPADVQCIQAGTVRVRASIDTYDKPFTFSLGKSQVVGDATITLVSVLPAQKFSTQTVQSSEYRFTFTVSNASR